MKLRVLVVDDEPLVVMLLEDMLDEAGYKVVETASNLRLGLEVASTAAYDLAILDVSLGADSSLPIARVLEERGVPYLFASGYGAQVGDEYGTVPVLEKPFTLPDLIEKVAFVLNPDRTKPAASIVARAAGV